MLHSLKECFVIFYLAVKTGMKMPPLSLHSSKSPRLRWKNVLFIKRFLAWNGARLSLAFILAFVRLGWELCCRATWIWNLWLEVVLVVFSQKFSVFYVNTALSRMKSYKKIVNVFILSTKFIWKSTNHRKVLNLWYDQLGTETCGEIWAECGTLVSFVLFLQHLLNSDMQCVLKHSILMKMRRIKSHG